MLLTGFLKIETFFPPCHPGEIETVTAVAELSDDISLVFPYLNAVLKGTIYDQTHLLVPTVLAGVSDRWGGPSRAKAHTGRARRTVSSAQTLTSFT